tara:strand:+ start:431 stop:1063 length:633 start_codon:yes stop_codon:yes gene_type:complete
MNKLLAVSTLILFTLVASLSWAGAKTPLEKTNVLVDILQQVATPAEGQKLNAAQKAANAKIYTQLDSMIDFKRLTEGPVAPHRKSLSKKQIKTIKGLFKDAIRNIAYNKSGSFFDGAELTWGTPVTQGKQIDVPLDIFVEEEDLEVSLVFHWAKTGKSLQLFDLSIDDASLVKDYQNQFGKIIKEEGAKSLVTKLKKRLDEAQKKHGTIS